MEDNGTKRWLSSARGVHELYLSIIAVTVIIILASTKWYAIPKLEELFSFALTVSSLVLAIVAIIYSIYSNASVESAVSSLVSAVGTIPTSAVKLETTAERLAGDIQKLAAVTDGLSTRIEVHHEELRTELRTVSGRLENERAPTPPSESIEPPAATEIRPDPAVMLSRCSITGMKVLLVAAHTAKTGKPANLTEIMRPTEVDYAHGFAVALYSTGGILGSPKRDALLATDLGTTYDEVRARLVERIHEVFKEGAIYATSIREVNELEEKLFGIATSASAKSTNVEPAVSLPPSAPPPSPPVEG